MLDYEIKKADIKERTFKFSLRIIALCRVLPSDEVNRILIRQVLRSGTSVGANIEEATGAHTKKDFTHGLNIAKKEARETNYWLRLIYKSNMVRIQKRMDDLLNESEEILKILVSSVKTAQREVNR